MRDSNSPEQEALSANFVVLNVIDKTISKSNFCAASEKGWCIYRRSAEAFARATPILEPMGKKIVRCGGPRRRPGRRNLQRHTN